MLVCYFTLLRFSTVLSDRVHTRLPDLLMYCCVTRVRTRTHVRCRSLLSGLLSTNCQCAPEVGDGKLQLTVHMYPAKFPFAIPPRVHLNLNSSIITRSACIEFVILCMHSASPSSFETPSSLPPANIECIRRSRRSRFAT